MQNNEVREKISTIMFQKIIPFDRELRYNNRNNRAV